MTRLESTFNIIALAAIMMTILFVFPALAQDSAQATALWPERSVAVSQSTRYLVTGHPAKAIQAAERALTEANSYDRAVALQNICLGHLNLGDAANAEPACEDALTAAAPYRGATAKFLSLQPKVQANIELAQRALSQRGTSVALSEKAQAR